MAQRHGLGAVFRNQLHAPNESIDAHLVSFSISNHIDRGIYFDDSPGYDSDEPSPYRRQHGLNLGQSYDSDRGISSERSWTPSSSPSPSPPPIHQFFTLRECKPLLSQPPPTLTSQDGPPQKQQQSLLLDYSNTNHNTTTTHHAHPRTHPHTHCHSHPQLHHSNHHREIANESPFPVAFLMERMTSGRNIFTEPSTASELGNSHTAGPSPFSPEQDRDAAHRVKQHMCKPAARVRHHERILRALIHPRAPRATEFPLDHAALQSIFRAADEIFFQGKLSRRVHWEWSSFASPPPPPHHHHHHTPPSSRIIGTTALRHAPGDRGGYETLIVLSSPILTDTSYNRRLLISTFLHELIHSYLFICCGFKAQHSGGHTDGFLEIARLIDAWAGSGTLKLGEVEADLEHFREDPLPLPLPFTPKFCEEPLAPARRSLVADGYFGMPAQQQQPASSQQLQRHHHRGEQDFYDLTNPTPWSTGPKMVFGA